MCPRKYLISQNKHSAIDVLSESIWIHCAKNKLSCSIIPSEGSKPLVLTYELVLIA